MPSLKDIRRRISSVKNTQKITRAMKLVAAAKLRRAQDAIINARPYARKMRHIVQDLGSRADAGDHPLLAQRRTKRALLVVLTSDRGLCGAFNSSVLRQAEITRNDCAKADVSAEPERTKVHLAVLGRKGNDYFRYRGIAPDYELSGVEVLSARERSIEVSTAVSEAFLAERVDIVHLVYNEFKSAMSQKTVVETLLPIAPAANLSDGARSDERGDLPAELDFIYEPSKRDLLNTVLPLYLEVEIYRALLESTASEYGSRMTAMENATNNASDMVSNLTLDYNKARQAAITKELLEIVSGAEAL